MKTLTSLFLMLSLALAVSCGGDKSKKKDNLAFYDLQANPYQQPVPTTMNGLFNPQSGVLEVGGQTYQANQVYGVQGGQTMPTQQLPGMYPQQTGYPQQGAYAMQPSQQIGYMYINQVFQTLQQFRPAYYANGIVKYNVRVIGYSARYAGMSTPVLVLTQPLQAF